jgi:hypothetical protein
MDVEQWTYLSAQPVSYLYGTFEMRGSQLVLADTQNPPFRFGLTLATTFGKLAMVAKTGGPPFTVTDSWVFRDKNPTPLLAAIPSGDPRTVTWTISYNENVFGGRPAGFITEIDSAAAHGSRTYFSIPPLRQIVGRDPPLVTLLFNHIMSPPLMQSAVQDGLDAIYSALANESGAVDPTMIAEAFGNFNGYTELSTPYSIYNWELGVHVIALIMERLLATCQYDLIYEIEKRFR